jgi:hypothetical protein
MKTFYLQVFSTSETLHPNQVDCKTNKNSMSHVVIGIQFQASK